MAKKLNVRPLRFWLLWDDVLFLMSVAFIWAKKPTGNFSGWRDMAVFRFCVSVRKYFADLWTQQLSINMLQNCTEHVILVDKQLSFYSTFWFDPIFMPKLANIWQKRLPQGSIFNFRRFSLVFLSFINRSTWKLVKMCILISLTNHITATFWSDPIYMPKQAKICENRPLRQPFLSYICLFWHVSGVWSKICINMIG